MLDARCAAVPVRRTKRWRRSGESMEDRLGSAAAQPAPGEPARTGERAWLASLALSRAFITLVFMTYAAALPTLTLAWSMSATQAGLVQTCFSVGFAVSLFITSWLADYVGARRIFLWSCWLGAAAALAFALFARSFEQALWLYGLVGFTQGGSYTPAIMLAAQRLPPARRSCQAVSPEVMMTS